MAADDLVTQVTRASIAMVLTWFALNIPLPAQKGLNPLDLQDYNGDLYIKKKFC